VAGAAPAAVARRARPGLTRCASTCWPNAPSTSQRAVPTSEVIGIGRPEHLVYGVLHDACDPLGTQLGRRSRRELATLGWTAGRSNPLRLPLEARGVDLTRLAGRLAGSQ
jgi:hypothetical protein